MINAAEVATSIQGDQQMAKIRTTYRSGLFAALMLAACGFGLATPVQAAETTTQCSGTLSQYDATIRQLETFSARAQALADQNPLYISDVEYYASALAQAQRCAKNLGTVATVSR
jgi:hypothetical protein